MMSLGDRFPYGKAPFWLLAIAVVSGTYLLLARYEKGGEEYDLEFAVFSAVHLDAYREILPHFEKEHNVRVKMELVNQKALQGRLQNAMLAGAEVPDMVELVENSMGFFCKGPLEDVMFVDLTERIRRDGLDTSMVYARYSLWSSRGHIFALPHDVHPVMLAYRRDIVEKLGIEVDSLDTWEKFAAVGRRITVDTTGDSVLDRYAITLSPGYNDLKVLLLQRGVEFFDSQGRLAYNEPGTIDVMRWYLDALHGEKPFAYSISKGQMMSKLLSDGFILFTLAPDWYSKSLERDIPGLKSKMALMPLPAWEPGGRRTSIQGGTGLAITKQCARPELAWKLAKYLYLSRTNADRMFSSMNILPPTKTLWDMPVLAEKNVYYSDQAIGLAYASLAGDVPPYYATAYSRLSESKLNEVYARAVLRYDPENPSRIDEFLKEDLRRVSAQIQKIIDYNAFLKR